MRPRHLCRALTLLFALAIAALAAPPEILKIEPPNWWAGHSINPVRLMIRGRNLTGARVEALRSGMTPSLTAVNPAGTYVFADVAIDSSAAPGSYPLRSPPVSRGLYDRSKPRYCHGGDFQGIIDH
jgi:hypothetical protein